MRAIRRTTRAHASTVSLTLLLIGSASLTGCYTTTSSSPDLRPPPPDQLILFTANGSRIRLADAQVHDGVISGRVDECDYNVRAKVRLDQPPPPPYSPMERGCIPEGTNGAIRAGFVTDMARRDYDAKKTAAAVVPLVVLGAAASAVTIAAAAGAFHDEKQREPAHSISVSCPRVYSFDGEGWRLDSGTYGTAYFEAAQRTDYDLLEHLHAVDGEYRLRMKNELNETEHVDALGVWTVDHPVGTWVVPAPSGDLLTFRSPRPPLSATDLRGADVLDSVARLDGHPWKSDLDGRDPTRRDDTRDGVQLVFPKARGAREVKLWMTGMNTRWAAQLVSYMMALKGERLPELYARLNQSAIARALMRRLFVEVGLLAVHVRTKSGWSSRGVFEAAGNEIAKGQAVRIPVADIPGDRLELKLESAVGMWLVDSIAVEYGADEALDVRRLPPRRAVSHDGRDVTRTLSQIDGDRHDSERGEWVDLFFDAPPEPAAGRQRSFVLATTGYDTLHIEPRAGADPAEADALLLSPDATSRRSLELLLEAALARGAAPQPSAAANGSR